MFKFVRRFKVALITLAAVGAAVLVLAVVLQPFQKSTALVTVAASVIDVSADCTQATIHIDDDGVGAGGSDRDANITFTDPTAQIAPFTIYVSCSGATNAPQCDGPVTPDDFVVNINGGAGYSSAVDIPLNISTVQPVFTAGLAVYDAAFIGPLDLPACIPGAVAAVAAPAPLPPLDPPGTAPRVWGNYNSVSALVVYDQPYGYQFYHASGQVVGLVDFNLVGIPGPMGLITSISSNIWRVDIYYTHGNYVQANLYENGALIAEATFEVDGIGARAGEVSGQPVPPFGGGGGGTTDGGGIAVASAQTSPGQVQVVCRQNLRQDASTDTPVLLVMDTGSMVSVMGRSNDNSWLQVATHDGVTGWAYNGQCMNAPTQSIQQAPVEVVFDSQPTVTNDALTQQQQAPAVTNVAAPASTGPVVGIVCRQNMRSGPGTGFAVARVLDPGANLTVIGRSSDGTWLQVTSTLGDGWTYFGQCVLPQSGDVTSAPVTVAFGG